MREAEEEEAQTTTNKSYPNWEGVQMNDYVTRSVGSDEVKMIFGLLLLGFIR